MKKTRYRQNSEGRIMGKNKEKTKKADKNKAKLKHTSQTNIKLEKNNKK